MDELIIDLLFFAVPLIVCGLIIGRTVERRHLAGLTERETQNSHILITQLKSFPMAAEMGPDPALVVAEVVIASDYLKTFLASWRNIFGGEVKSFSRLQTRAKREAVQRLVEQAKAGGFNAICNVRLDTVDIGGATSSGKFPMATILASGTAYFAGPPQ